MTIIDEDRGTKDRDGYPLKEQSGDDLALASEVEKRWKDCDRSLIVPRRHYWLNYSFYCDEQWLRWDSSRNVPELLDEESERFRTTLNLIASRVDRIVGRLAQKDLYFDVAPTGPDDPTISGAELSKHVLEYERKNQDWESLREDTLYNCLFGGAGAVSVEWDKHAGALYEDPTSGDMVGEGNVELQAWSIAEFGLEPGAANARSARWWVCSRVMSPEQVRDKYKLDWTPRSDGLEAYSALQRKLIEGSTGNPNATAVYCMYERPNILCPEGRVVAVVNGRVIQNDPWPFPFTDRLNLVVFLQRTLNNKWYGYTILNGARMLQVMYNMLQSGFGEYAFLCGNVRLWVEDGSLPYEDELTDEQGEIAHYYAGFQIPTYVSPAEIPRSTLDIAAKIEEKLDEILYSHEVARGVAPGDRNSGLALSVLAERNDTPLGPMARRQARGWSSVGSMVLELFNKNVTSQRRAVMQRDSGVPRVLEWNPDKLHHQTDVTVPMEAVMALSPALWRAQLIETKQAFPEAFTNVEPTAWPRLLQLSSSEQMQGVIDDDAGRAIWENDMLATGEAIKPSEFEDHGRHIAEHNRYRNSPAYYYMPEDIKHLFELHLQAHQRLQEEEMEQQRKLNELVPGAAAMPQANEPVGSAVPVDYATATGGAAAA